MMELQEQAADFARALCRYVAQELRNQDGEYVRGAVKVADARNHLFMPQPHQGTDESTDIYALADLCHVDDDMQTVPDLNRALGVARNYF
ncbi:MAG: hypothetical protein IJ253_05740 [Bacteroidaceae bacterium]|nr:hypothetical protein [Bacteroidaceae bacterium]